MVEMNESIEWFLGIMCSLIFFITIIVANPDCMTHGEAAIFLVVVVSWYPLHGDRLSDAIDALRERINEVIRGTKHGK